MMYIHYCKPCNRVHILNGHKQQCPRCDSDLTELKLSYLDYTGFSIYERSKFLDKLGDPLQLAEFRTIYRMHKYSKWYKKMMDENNAEKIQEKGENHHK